MQEWLAESLPQDTILKDPIYKELKTIENAALPNLAKELRRIANVDSASLVKLFGVTQERIDLEKRISSTCEAASKTVFTAFQAADTKLRKAAKEHEVIYPMYIHSLPSSARAKQLQHEHSSAQTNQNFLLEEENPTGFTVTNLVLAKILVLVGVLKKSNDSDSS